MESRRELHLAGLVFDVVKYKNPEYLHAKIKFVNENSRNLLRSIRSALLYHSHKTAAFTGSFRYLATKCWNNIPPPIRNLNTKFTFKTNLRAYLLGKQKLGIPKHFVCQL